MDQNKTLLALPAETRKRLEDMQSQLEGINNALASLKKMGIEVSQLENMIEVTSKQKDILLTEFK